MGKTVVVDVSGLDGIKRIDHAHLKRSPLVDRQSDFPIPEDMMDKLEELIGDGNASVTVGAEMKFSDFGNGYNSSVFVKLTCGQDMDTILATRDLGQELAARFVNDGFDEMHAAYNKAIGKPVNGEKKQINTKAPAKATKKKKFTIQR